MSGGWREGGRIRFVFALLLMADASAANAGTLTWEQNLTSELLDSRVEVRWSALQRGDEPARDVSVELEVGTESRAGMVTPTVFPGTSLQVTASFNRPRLRGRIAVVSRLRYHDPAGAPFGSILAHVQDVAAGAPPRLAVTAPGRVVASPQGQVGVIVEWRGDSPTRARVRAEVLPELLNPLSSAPVFAVLSPGMNLVNVSLPRCSELIGPCGLAWVVVDVEEGGQVDAAVASFELAIEDGATPWRPSIVVWAVSGLLLVMVLARARKR